MTNPDNTGWVGSWSPGIGDPTVMGWATVVFYAIAAVLCHRAARRCNHTVVARSTWLRESTLWKFLAVALWLLCVNKQLDMQTAMTELGRLIARRQGWYEYRQLYQEMLIAGLLLSGMFGGVLVLAVSWRMSRALKLAMLGLCFIGVFVFVRASSFHHVDLFLRRRVMGARWNWILEIGGISVVGLAARARTRAS